VVAACSDVQAVPLGDLHDDRSSALPDAAVGGSGSLQAAPAPKAPDASATGVDEDAGATSSPTGSADAGTRAGAGGAAGPDGGAQGPGGFDDDDDDDDSADEADDDSSITVDAGSRNDD
jgi:hypothetical protein